MQTERTRRLVTIHYKSLTVKGDGEIVGLGVNVGAKPTDTPLPRSRLWTMSGMNLTFKDKEEQAWPNLGGAPELRPHCPSLFQGLHG